MRDAQTRLESDIATLRDCPLFVAYNANVDALVRVDERLEATLDPPDEPPGKTDPLDRLRSKRDLATAVTHTMATGEGDEVAMTGELTTQLESDLVADSRQLGGQAGIMTNLLAALGAAPIIYTYLLSERQLSMFDSPEVIRFPRVEDGRVRFVPLPEAVNTDRTKTNWIFEFERGTDLFGVSAVADTRFIAASRPPEFDLFMDGLDPFVDQVGAAVDGALLAGYHNLTPEHLETDYGTVHRHARDVLDRLRAGGDLPIHVEYAVTHDDALRQSLTDIVLPEADVIGLDAHELGLLGEDLGVDPSGRAGESTPPVSDDRDARIVDHYRTLTAVRDRLDVPCVRLHAMEYHLAVTDDYLSPAAVRRGLEFAAVCAATKAATGHIAAAGDLERGLAYDPAREGRAAIEALAAHLDRSADDGRLCTETVVAAPNRVVDAPAGTVGIGDIVSAASFALEVAAASDEDGPERE
jgi:ADP-dependent phosphofructokinase/glucokinase